MDRFELAATELAILAEMKEVERKLHLIRAEARKDESFGLPMKWIEVHFYRETGGAVRIRETFPLYPTPVVDRSLGEPIVHYRPKPVEIWVHLDMTRARKAYEAFRAEGAAPLPLQSKGVAAHAPWTAELEAMLRAI